MDDICYLLAVFARGLKSSHPISSNVRIPEVMRICITSEMAAATSSSEGNYSCDAVTSASQNQTA